MADRSHIEILNQGLSTWNSWRHENREIQPDLAGASLNGADLKGMDLVEANLAGAYLEGADLVTANLAGANLSGARLRHALLRRANLTEADLTGADLMWANIGAATLIEAKLPGALLGEAYLVGAELAGSDLSKADLGGADLRRANCQGAILEGADLSGTNLGGANLRHAVLTSANLELARLVGTFMEDAHLLGCQVYGASAWDLKLEGAEQRDLVITPRGESSITVDDLEVAQFIYTLLNNAKLRAVIDTITSKVVLVLGRFTPKRKTVLDALRNELRRYNYVPVVFDFDKPTSRSFVETVSILAHMARFVIADFTSAKIVLHEVPHIVQSVAVPVKPLMSKRAGREPVTLNDLRVNHRCVLDTFRYGSIEDLLSSLQKEVIGPAEAMSAKLARS